MYACTYVCIYIWMYTYISIYKTSVCVKYVGMTVYTYACKHVKSCINVYVCMNFSVNSQNKFLLLY